MITYTFTVLYLGQLLRLVACMDSLLELSAILEIFFLLQFIIRS